MGPPLHIAPCRDVGSSLWAGHSRMRVFTPKLAQRQESLPPSLPHLTSSAPHCPASSSLALRLRSRPPLDCLRRSHSPKPPNGGGPLGRWQAQAVHTAAAVAAAPAAVAAAVTDLATAAGCSSPRPPAAAAAAAAAATAAAGLAAARVAAAAPAAAAAAAAVLPCSHPQCCLSFQSAPPACSDRRRRGRKAAAVAVGMCNSSSRRVSATYLKQQ
eukprot:1159892-Pelagomonas_calceolata.AAC.11